jgi:MFS transporter, MHS family, proline/betaine transporter
MPKISLRPLVAFLGNLFEHYSSAVFCLCTPLLMPIFFPSMPISSNLIKAFSLLPLTIITKPIGAVAFSYLAQKKGPEFSLKCSYFGMALTSLSFSLIPLNANPDFLYVFLVLTRLLQGFFSSGETINGAIYVLDHTHDKQKGLAAGFYDACSLAGYVIASYLIYYFQKADSFHTHWRLLFILGAFTVLPAFFLKKPAAKDVPEISSDIKLTSLLKITIVTGISYAFFSLCFVFTNSLAFFQKYDSHTISKQTTTLLIIDLCILPMCGLISRKIPYQVLMKGSLFIASITVPIMLGYAESFSLIALFFMRLFFTILGATFSSGVFRFCKDTLPFKTQTVALSLSFSLGSSLIGQSFALVSTTIYKFFPSLLNTGLFFSCLCLLGLTTLQKNLEKAPKLV